MPTRSTWVWAGSIIVALAVGAILGVRWWGQSASSPEAPRPAAPAAPPAASPPAPPSTPAAPSPPPVKPEETPFLQIEGTRLSGTDPQGRRLWDLRAQTLDVDRGQQRIRMTAVTGQFYREGAVQLAFTAPRAVFTIGSKDIELAGGIVARTPDGRTLRAATIRYEGARRTLTATGGVVLAQAGLSIRADQLHTDAGLEQPRFSGNIVVRVTE